MSSETEHHSGTFTKLKNLFNSEADQPSSYDSSFEQTREHLHEARSEHERLEQQADALRLEREAKDALEATYSSPPPINDTTEEAAAGAPEEAQLGSGPRRQASIKKGDQKLSTVKPRASLKRASRNQRPRFEADMEGVTHVPEDQLHHRSHEMQNTALRPSNPEDPTAMDGRPSGDALRTAGEDLAI